MAPAKSSAPSEKSPKSAKKPTKSKISKGASSSDVDQICSEASHWPQSLILKQAPPAFILPQELLSFKASDRETHKKFAKGAVIRQIYMHQPLTEDEQTYLREWREFIREESFGYPKQLEPMILRLLYFSKRKFKEKYLHKTREHVMRIVEWRQSYFPITEEEVSPELNAGMMYWIGRDSSMRPLLVVKLCRMPKESTPAKVARVCIFCMEYILRYGMFPGRNETCRVLIDLKGVPVHKIPVGTLKEMASTLTKQYPFRMDRMYILNSPRIVQSLWNVMKSSGVLSEVQLEKINFYRSNFAEALLAEYAPHQLEDCYGGTAQVKSYFPFPLQPGPFEPYVMDGPRENHVSDVWKVFDDDGFAGMFWEASTKPSVKLSKHAKEIFDKCGVAVGPEVHLPLESTPKGLAVTPHRRGSGKTSPMGGQENLRTPPSAAKHPKTPLSGDKHPKTPPYAKTPPSAAKRRTPKSATPEKVSIKRSDTEMRSLLDNPSDTERLLPHNRAASTRISLLNSDITEPIDIQTGKPLHKHATSAKSEPPVEAVTVFDAWENREEKIPVQADPALSPLDESVEITTLNGEKVPVELNGLCGAGSCATCVVQ